MEVQFLIDGISFEFYPISWERAKRMASFDHWNTTIIADCEFLYVRSEEDRERFMKLRDLILSMKEPSKAISLNKRFYIIWLKKR